MNFGNVVRKISRFAASISLWHITLSAVVALGIFCFNSAGAADTDDFFTQSFSPSGKLLTVLPLQFDGTGSSELAMVVRGDQRGYKLQIYRESSVRVYNQTPMLSLDIPASVFAIQAVDYDNDKRAEIALLGLESIFVVDYDNGGTSATAKEIGKFERLFSVPQPDMIVEYAFLFDLNGDSKYEAVLPSWDGVRILKNGNPTFTALNIISINHGSLAHSGGNQLAAGSSCGMAISLPTIGAFDINTDRTLDLVVASASGLAVCFQLGDLQFPTTPSQMLEVRTAFLDNLQFMSWGFGDLNGDKVTDYCRVLTQGTNDQYKTIVEFYLAVGQSGFSQRPSKRIVLDDYCLGLSVSDLDGDGSASAIVATVGVSLTSMVKSLLVKRMQVDLNIFQPVDGILTEQPTAIKKIGCGIDFFGAKVPTRFVGCTHGDFDRDNLNELVTLNDDDEIEIFGGGKNAQFSDKPIITREIQRCNWLDASDLNYDGKSDLVLCSVDETGRDLVTLLWTK